VCMSVIVCVTWVITDIFHSTHFRYYASSTTSNLQINVGFQHFFDKKKTQKTLRSTCEITFSLADELPQGT
jgi:hypothetical protein